MLIAEKFREFVASHVGSSSPPISAQCQCHEGSLTVDHVTELFSLEHWLLELGIKPQQRPEDLQHLKYHESDWTLSPSGL